MKSTVKNIVLWILAVFMFLMAISAAAVGSVLGFILFTITGLFVSPLRKKIFEKLKLPNIKSIFTVFIVIGLFIVSVVATTTYGNTRQYTSNTSRSQVEEISSENDSLTAKVSQLNDKLNANKDEYQSKQEEYESSLKEKEAQIESQKSQIADLQDQINKLGDYQSQIDTLTAENNTLKNQISELQQQANDATNASTDSGAAVSSSSTTVSNSDSSNNDDTTVYITKTGEKYHRDGCRYLSQSKIPISKSDAISQGYDACSVCNP